MKPTSLPFILSASISATLALAQSNDSPPSSGDTGNVTYLEEVVVTGMRMSAPAAAPPPPPPPAPGGAAPSEAAIEAARLALQPPLRELSDSACVVYGLN